MERSEMDKYYDEISAQLDTMPRGFVLWYLIPSEIKELEEAIKQCGEPRNARESRMCYVFEERIKVLEQMREELGIGLWG